MMILSACSSISASSPRVSATSCATARSCSGSPTSWKKWGPYLSERQWGTVREDYSQDGNAWDYFSHDQARSRAYRWGEDGLAGISDDRQQLCFAIALWNGRDPILKERLFGLTNNEGNHGEDVKEYYFYLDSTPTHSYMEMVFGLEVIREPGYQAALLEAAITLNAAWSAYCLCQEFRAHFPDLGVVFGNYDLVSRRVRLPLSPRDEIIDEEQGLFAPPENAEQFRQLAHRICSGRLVQSLLG